MGEHANPANRSARLELVAAFVEKTVPTYDIKSTDPLIAAEFGIGNCLSKSVIGAVAFEHLKLLGSRPAIAWNTNTHPKLGNDLLGRPQRRNGHAFLLTAESIGDTDQISAISFNPNSQAIDDWQIFDFNDGFTAATARDGGITATEDGHEMGYVIHDWYDGAATYVEAVGISVDDSKYISMREEDLRAKILELLLRSGDLRQLAG